MLRKISRWIQFNLRYLGQPPWDTGVSPPELIHFLEDADPGRALDLGCGTGTNLLSMASFGWDVVGVELVWLAVLKARKRLREAGVDGRVLCGDVTQHLDLGGPFDLVLDIGCYHSLGSAGRVRYRQNLASWLKPGGNYLLYAHRQTEPTDTHGVTEADFEHFSRFLHLEWRQDSDESRPDGGGGRPATWARFERASKREI